MSVPGYKIADVSDTLTGVAADLVLRGKGSALAQALSLNPTFITLGIIGNDILTAGGAGFLLDGVTATPLRPFHRQVQLRRGGLEGDRPDRSLSRDAGHASDTARHHAAPGRSRIPRPTAPDRRRVDGPASRARATLAPARRARLSAARRNARHARSERSAGGPGRKVAARSSDSAFRARSPRHFPSAASPCPTAASRLPRPSTSASCSIPTRSPQSISGSRT